MKTNILILAAGQQEFEANDGSYPISLTEFDGKSLLERIVDNTRNIPDCQYSFAILEKDAERFHLEKVAKLLAPGAKVFRIPVSTKGSACTALLAASQLEDEDGLLIVSANELVEIDLTETTKEFKQRKLNAGTVVFRSVQPRYSYVRLNGEGHVTEAAQQNPISQHATAGIFWFETVKSFVDAAKDSIRKNASVGGKFFVAPTFNELILKNARIGVREIDIEKYRPLKTVRQIQQFENGIKI
jgi:hypothetical protein